MRLMMFAGESIHSRDWIYQARDQFPDLFDSFYVQNYHHWSTEGAVTEFAIELSTLEQRMPILEGPFGVFAKSIGTVVLAEALKQEDFRFEPQFMLLCGIPVPFIRENKFHDFRNVLAGTRVPTTIVQNQFDTVAHAAEVSEFIAPAFTDRSEYRFVVDQDNATHDYVNYPLLRRELNAFIGSQ